MGTSEEAKTEAAKTEGAKGHSAENMLPPNIFIGCAGWNVPREYAAHFPDAGSHLERYAARFACVEINSSFYKPHRPTTYARWATAVPAGFRFTVKVPREITHLRRLRQAEKSLDRFLTEVNSLGDNLGPLLVQLPPSLPFDSAVAPAFFAALRQRFDGAVVCEPRHPGWFAPDAEQVLVQFRVARVAVDPSAVPSAALPGGWDGLVYYRLHGSPRMYYSAYSEETLTALAHTLRAASGSVPTWCIFDNTAAGAATADVLRVLKLLVQDVLTENG